jgi:putative aminopeptidase FrvX
MNTNTRAERLKSLLAVPSFFLREHQMIEKIEETLSKIEGVKYWHDAYGNVYVIKGEAEFYPLVMAHTDTVHHLEEYDVVENKLTDMERGLRTVLTGINKAGRPSGIGGDNKTGIFTCLELLAERDVLKAAFFIGEEFGFHGSALSDPEFFTNVGYAFEFDAPENYWISHTCNGVRLFDPAGQFWQKCYTIMMDFSQKKTDPMRGNHPYTDIFIIKGYYDFSCLNFSSGYYRMHTSSEYVVVEDVEKAINTANQLIDALGTEKYTYVSDVIDRNNQVARRQHHIEQFIKFPELVK